MIRATFSGVTKAGLITMTDTLMLSAEGLRSRVRLAGAVGRPTLMLLHDGAYGTDGDLCWGPVMPELSGHFNLIVPDLLGWGGSDKVAFFDRSAYASRLQQIASVCRALSLVEQGIFLAGVSFGAELAVRAAIEPEWGIRPKAVVSISGTGGRLYRDNAAASALGAYEPSPAAALKLTRSLTSGMPGLTEHAQRRFELSLIPGHWETLSAVRLRSPALPSAEPDEGWLDRLDDVSVPILFVEGRQDSLMERGWAEKMSKRVPGSSWREVDGGHEPNLDHPSQVAELLREFFLR
jgi:pimeloyl-ACP methyl ester carboxylesterase